MKGLGFLQAPTQPTCLGNSQGMICEFELPDKTVREFMWHAKPLGLAFGSDSPPVVSKVTFPADKKGVKEGYILRRFGSDYRMMEATEDTFFE